MNNQEIIERMKYGDVVIVRFDDGCGDYIVKSKYFDQDVFILGGNGKINPTMITTNYGEKDISSIMDEINETINQTVVFEESDGRLDIEYTASEVFRRIECENFVFDKE